MSDFHMLASGVLVLGYQMETVLLCSTASLVYLLGGDVPQIFFVLAFCLYTISILLVGVMHLKDTIDRVLPLITAAVAILGGICIIVGMGVHAQQVGGSLALLSAVHAMSLILAIVGGVLMILGTFVFNSTTSSSTTTTTRTTTTMHQQY